MGRLKLWWQRTLKWQYSGLLLLVLLTLGLHFSTIMNPRELVFDEYHYVTDARSIISGEGTQRTEHPPLAKLFVVSGMRIFGDNPFGWRFFSVVFGTASIVLFFFICRALNMPGGATLLATFLFSLENMTFLHASVAMLDVFNVTFMLAAFLLYLRTAYILSGMSIALTTLCKLTGALTVPAIFLHWLLARRTRKQYFLLLLILGPAAFFFFLPSFDLLVANKLVDPISHIKDMLTMSSSLTFATVSHGAATRPWLWVLLPVVMFYWYTPHYIGAISFNVWAFIVPVVVYMAIRSIKMKEDASLFGLSWFAGTYLLWIPLSLVTDRISYVYYFYPTIGAICIGLGLGLWQLLDVWKQRRRGKLAWVALIGVLFFLLSHVAVFVMLSPVFAQWISVIPVPQ